MLYFTILIRSLLPALFNENLQRHLEVYNEEAHFERLFQINVRMNAQLSQRISNKVAPANVKDEEGASGQQRLQGEKHENILQVGSIDCYLEWHSHSTVTQSTLEDRGAAWEPHGADCTHFQSALLPLKVFKLHVLHSTDLLIWSPKD